VFTGYRAQGTSRQGKLIPDAKLQSHWFGYRRAEAEKEGGARSAQSPIAEAVYNVIVYHSHRLHEGVADGGSDEVEPVTLEILADRIGVRRPRRDLLERPGRVESRLAFQELPEVAVEAAKFFLHFKKRLRVSNGGGNLELVADDAGIAQELSDLALVIAATRLGSNPAKAWR
jgi:hypothetical protein